MDDARAQALHDVLARLKPRGRTGGLGLGVLGAKGKSTSICEPGDPKAGLYAHFVRAGAGGHHRFDEQEVDAELSATKKTKNKKKKKKEALKEDQTSVAEAAPTGGKRKKEDKEPAPAAATKKKQKKQMTVEAPFVSAACAPVSDEPKSPAARLAKLERRLKKACRSGDKTAEASLKTRIEKLRRKAQKQHDQPSSPS